jgi:hypothetical protein
LTGNNILAIRENTMDSNESGTGQHEENLDRWIGDSSETESSSIEVIEPDVETEFAVEVKSGALTANNRLREIVDQYGERLEFGSRHNAEKYAHQLSNSDGSVKIQAAPENDPSGIDAYLLADPDTSITEPATTNDEEMTFDVGANLYGELGETVLLGPSKPHALIHFVREDLDISKRELNHGLYVDIEVGILVAPVEVDLNGGWIPDCIVKAYDGRNGELMKKYFCEIKTGDASFERSQVEVMEALARTERVLKIRVNIEDLPDQYSIRINDVEPTE